MGHSEDHLALQARYSQLGRSSFHIGSMPDLKEGLDAYRFLAQQAHISGKNSEANPDRKSLHNYMPIITGFVLPRVATYGFLGELHFAPESFSCDAEGHDNRVAKMSGLRNVYNSHSSIIRNLDIMSRILTHEDKWKRQLRMHRSPEDIEEIQRAVENSYKYKPFVFI